MTTLQLPLEHAKIRMNMKTSGGIPAGRSATKGYERDQRNDGPSFLWMAAYFLALGSVAVVALSGQFPWFTLAPLTVLLMFLHFRRVETKLRRQSSRAH